MLAPGKLSDGCLCVWQCWLATFANPDTAYAATYKYVWWTYNVCALWVVGQEVHDPPALLDVGLGVGPQAVNQVWEHDAVLMKNTCSIKPH